jgi:hypothetical protein
MPAAHSKHATDPYDDAWPAEQETQTVEAAAPAVGEYFPDGQLAHHEDPTVEYMPAAQLLHVLEVKEYMPAAQLMHIVAPPCE